MNSLLEDLAFVPGGRPRKAYHWILPLPTSEVTKYLPGPMYTYSLPIRFKKRTYFRIFTHLVPSIEIALVLEEV